MQNSKDTVFPEKSGNLTTLLIFFKSNYLFVQHFVNLALVILEIINHSGMFYWPDMDLHSKIIYILYRKNVIGKIFTCKMVEQNKPVYFNFHDKRTNFSISYNAAFLCTHPDHNCLANRLQNVCSTIIQENSNIWLNDITRHY